jgi:hypothetical protein
LHLKPHVHCNMETSWQPSGGELRLRWSQGWATSNRKGELPMEFTATLTALTAIMSFGFIAAVILGMI